MKLYLAFIAFIIFFGLFFKLTSLPRASSSSAFTSPPLTSVALKTGVFPQFPTPTPTSIPILKIGLVGDLGLGRLITATARSKKDFSWSFQQISPWLQANDLNLANLESPLVANCPTVAFETFTFCGDSQFIPYLKSNKFAFNIANNHILNYGTDGFNQTVGYLTSAQIPFSYSLMPQYEFSSFNQNGISIGILGFDLVTYPKYDHQKIIDLVKKYNSQVDWLIVSLHWGNEYQAVPSAWQVDLAHQLIDAGADVIHGHHPHVYQALETYHDRPIFYSLGNFIFDQNWSVPTSTSNIVRLTLTKDKIQDLTLFPIEIKSNSQPILKP